MATKDEIVHMEKVSSDGSDNEVLLFHGLININEEALTCFTEEYTQEIGWVPDL